MPLTYGLCSQECSKSSPPSLKWGGGVGLVVLKALGSSRLGSQLSYSLPGRVTYPS